MNAGQKGVRRLAASNGLASSDIVCTSCRHRLIHQSSRNAATAAAVAEEQSHSDGHQQHIPPVTATAPSKAYRLLASPVLSRPPQLTRELTGFEKAYYLYQKRLNERLALPFTRYFYYQKGTPADPEWKRKARARKTAARDIGVYDAYGEEGWNDEVLVGSQISEPQNQVEALIRDAEGKLIIEEKPAGKADKPGETATGETTVGERQRRELHKVEVPRPMPRATEADRSNDTRSLSRKLDRSLYLLVKNKEGRWRFPEDRVYGRENLHQAAERVLVQSCGVNMNTWIVGNHPVGHHAYSYQSAILSKLAANQLVPTSSAERGGEEGVEREEHGEKVFFMKARIMAGQANVSKNEYGDSEFQWLAKEEVQKAVTPGYWSSVRNMLVDR